MVILNRSIYSIILNAVIRGGLEYMCWQIVVVATEWLPELRLHPMIRGLTWSVLILDNAKNSVGENKPG